MSQAPQTIALFLAKDSGSFLSHGTRSQEVLGTGLPSTVLGGSQGLGHAKSAHMGLMELAGVSSWKHVLQNDCTRDPNHTNFLLLLCVTPLPHRCNHHFPGRAAQPSQAQSPLGQGGIHWHSLF